MDFNEQESLRIPTKLPLLPVRDLVVFPYMIVPLFVSRELSIAAVEESLAGDRLVFLAAQREAGEDEPGPKDIYQYGSVGLVMRMRKLADGRIKILVQGLLKARIRDFLQERPYLKVGFDKVIEPPSNAPSAVIEALMRSVKENLEQIISVGKVLSPDILLILSSINDPGRLADLVASNLGLKVKDSQEILETLEPIERLKKVNELVSRELQILKMQAEIQSQAKEEMNKSQREYFLREQLRAIKNELGESDGKTEEIEDYRKKLKEAELPEDAAAEAKKQLKRLEQMHQESSEAAVIRTYLDWLSELPWAKATKDNLDIIEANRVLDEDHYDLEKVKERILEYLGVRKLKADNKGPILCFVGPPGVGKTSLGKSIARALGRKFVRISLGGVRDEAEIRGHRRTYVGAMPGRIIQSIKQAGSNNPVFMMDEMDKIGADFRGDPAAALLEVLDPEQNHSFRDHYLNLDFDLSNVMFIGTANLLDPIPPALKDRMEVLHLSGYTEEEKLHIATRYLVPKQLEENGLTSKMLSFSNSAIMAAILGYTREAGLRNLERVIARICRKVARKMAEGWKDPIKVTRSSLHKYMGPVSFEDTPALEKNEIGVATGLAWTQYGGEILHVEVTAMKGKPGLLLTGQLGDVMKESAQAALSYARSKAKEFQINEAWFNNREIHIHVPAGAIPKDGPSAGIAIATALISIASRKPIRRDLAMTGEITLRGRILPIGGVKEKLLAAARARCNLVVLPKQNEKDMEDIPVHLKRKLQFLFVDQAEQAVRAALVETAKQ
ncbi:MAG: endopeptidase La [Deltaproteobacteria bacterium]|nr:endopeptidase La [Deltaproteobacteria bacterium]